MTDLTFGKPRYYRPVCIRHPHGYIGGPAGYEETDDPHAEPRVITEGVPLWVQRLELDWRENNAKHE